MKRKFVNGILLVALLVSSVSCFVSCKDYDEDIYVDMRGRLANEATLREALEAQLKTLQSTVNGLQTQLDNLKKCECDLSDYLKKDALADYATKEQLNALIARVAALETTKTLLEDRIAAIDGLLNTLDSRVTTLEQKIILMDQEIIASKTAGAEALKKAQEALDKANEALAQQAVPYDDTDLRNLINNLNEVVNGLKVTVANLDARVQAVEGVAADALEKAKAAQATANSNYVTINSMKQQIETINEWIANHGTDYDDAALRKLISDLTARIEAIESNYCTLCDLEVAMELAQKANDAIASIRDSIANGDIVTLGQLRDSLSNYVTKPEFYDSIKWIRDSINNFSERIANLEDSVHALTEDIQKMITGIIVQGTESPVLGYFNAPLDTRSTVLAVYYGKPNEKWEFPSRIPSNYVNGSSDFALWTPRNIAITGKLNAISGFTTGGAGENLVSMNANGEEEGNAGTLYVTVNPANVNFTGQTLKLKDSQDGDAYCTLSELQRSDRLLTMGYTRAAENGFYEAKATIKPADVENAALKVDYESLESDAKAIWNERSKNSVLEMGSSLVKLFQDIIPAYAVMGSWTDKSSGTVHNIYSQYNLAATAIKPLSFAFMQGTHISSMPGMEKLQDLVGEMIDKIKIKVNFANDTDFSKYKDIITLADFDIDSKVPDGTFTASFHFTLVDNDDKEVYVLVMGTDGKYYWKGTDGRLYDKTTGDIVAVNVEAESIKLKGKVSEDLTPEARETLKKLISSEQANNLVNLLNDVASLGNIDSKVRTSISDAKEDTKSQINSYITRANNKLAGYFNRLPGFLRLAMIGGADNKIGLLSMSKKLPTKSPSTTLKLVPTTYSLELLAPAYAKFVAVTDVFNADGSEVAVGTAKSLASAANGDNMGKVIDAEKTCTMNGQSGYIYEVTYTAVDYFGKVAIRKYYVKF